MSYHVTHRSRLESIMSDGLLPGSEHFMMRDIEGDNGAVDLLRSGLYGGKWPIFLSDKPWIDRDDLPRMFGKPADYVLLSVDDSGLQRLPDVLMLGSLNPPHSPLEGLIFTEKGISWPTKDDPLRDWTPTEHPFAKWAESDGFLRYSLLVTDQRLIAAICTFTGTLAIPVAIDRSRIKITGRASGVIARRISGRG